MNSINWARVMAQIVYYVTTVARLGRCSFAVPTGNFGNIFAGWIAERMGLPIDQLVIGSNSNDILTRWVADGSLIAEAVVPTYSPSMDIQVSSNHERLLFELRGRDGARTAELLDRFRGLGAVEAPHDHRFEAAAPRRRRRRSRSSARCTTPPACSSTRTPRSASAPPGPAAPATSPMVGLATAHPAKFPDAVERATGIRPALPDRLADLFDRPERFDVLPADVEAVRAHVLAAVA